MPIDELTPDRLYRCCGGEGMDFETTADLDPVEEIVGQPRAVAALRFGTDIDREGYNLFVLGPPGTGKRTLVTQMLEQRAPNEPAPDDWCYVQNFEDRHKPRALRLPAGRGRQLRDDVEQLLEDVPHAISSTFESDEYQEARQEAEQEVKQHQEQMEEELQKEAKERGLAVVRTPQGLAVVPTDDEGDPMPPDQIQTLSQEERERLESEAEEVQQKAQEAMQSAPRLEREKRQKLKKLNEQYAGQALEPLLADLRDAYDDVPAVVEHLDAVERDMVENGQDLLHLSQAEQGGGGGIQEQLAKMMGQQGGGQQTQGDPLRKYRVNLLVDHDPAGGAPIEYEDHPTYPNLIGRIEHMARMGALVTDFNLIKAGALHKANGGYLILDAYRLLSQPYVWDALKRALHEGQIRIETLGQSLGLMPTVALEPEPIPLDVKVVLMGRPIFYRLLRALDPDFAELFKVPADFETRMDRDDESHLVYARLLATLVRKHDLLPLSRDAVCRVMERSSRLAGDAHKLSIHMRQVTDVLHEADYWARQEGRDAIEPADVAQAVEAQVYRSDRIHERVGEEIERGTLLVDTEGAVAGQVNGLAVVPFGDFRFGRPTRITARARMGRGEVVDIEREVELGGPVHSKGVLILSGFISGRYARDLPLSLSASLVFEQSYAPTEGDSASSAELYALLSAVADVPLKQSIAVTGSVNQHGRVQAIGAVNEKIEGFFDVCARRGLTGEQGVLIPASNVQHLMLRADVRQAVEDGRFHVWAVETIDEGIELLTGLDAGKTDKDGTYPPKSVNGKVAARLDEFARQRRKFGVPGGEEKRER
jgi:lon-related putative ATP-dependent protease